ncbi:MAG: hypothetical protein ACKV0T_22555 [Planctomycetales bacterium]
MPTPPHRIRNGAITGPRYAATTGQGVPYLKLNTLLELKIASGMTAAHRPRDLDDVIQLIRINALPEDFASQLHPFVREKYVELWQSAQISEDY